MEDVFIWMQIVSHFTMFWFSKKKYHGYISATSKQNKSNTGRKKRPKNLFLLLHGVCKVNCLYTCIKYQIHICRFLLNADDTDFATLFIHIYLFLLKEMGPDPKTFKADGKSSLFTFHSLDPAHEA